MRPEIFARNRSMLTSWKDIAQYMGKGVRTVQRWEQDFGLPVRRPAGSSKRAVLARAQDLDAWVALRCPTRAAAPLTGTDSTCLHILAALSAEIRTARALHETNRILLREVNAAVRKLRENVGLSFDLSNKTAAAEDQEPAGDPAARQ